MLKHSVAVAVKLGEPTRGDAAHTPGKRRIFTSYHILGMQTSLVHEEGLPFKAGSEVQDILLGVDCCETRTVSTVLQL